MRRALTLLALLFLATGADAKSNSVLRPFVRTIHAGAVAGPPVTIFTNAVPNQGPGNEGSSFRQELAAPAVTGSSQGHIQVTITSNGGAGGLQLDHASYCISTGASGNCTAVPTEVTFPASCGASCTGGASGHGFNCSAWPCTALSDWIVFAAAGTDVVVIMDINSTAGKGNVAVASAAVTGATNWYRSGTSSWNTQSVTGFTPQTTTVNAVALIQTKP